MNRDAIMLSLAAVAALAACARGPEAPAVTEVASTSADGCIDHFVQVFESGAVDVPVPPEGLCYDNASADGPPRFPSMFTRVRLEYDGGDYYAVQERASWLMQDGPDMARGCMVALLRKSKVIKRVVGGVTESSATDDGETLRSVDTGEQYGGRIDLGAGPVEMVGAAGPAGALVREQSPFGNCLRGVTANSSLCSLEQPRRCRSSQIIMPIEIRIPNALGGGTQIGRTTSFEHAAIDKSTWELP